MKPRSATPVLAMLCLLTVACGGAELHDPAPPVGHPVLPDLVPAPPINLQMTRVGSGWHVSFSSIMVNVADGDFILRAKREGDEWRVEQVIPYSTSGAKVVSIPARLAWGGDGHSHWHVSRVASNRVVPLDDKGRTSPKGGRIDSKAGFCFFDYSKQLEKGPDKAVYSRHSCGHEDDNVIAMGLSPGWGDTYPLWLPGQSIDVSDLEDGRYRLWSAVDERGWFREVTRTNNATWVNFKLSTKSGFRFAQVLGVGPKPAPTP